MTVGTRTTAKNTFKLAAISALLAGLTSSVHHWFGAYIYDTPWRLVVSLWIPAFTATVLLMLYLHWKVENKRISSFAVWFIFFGGVVFQAGFTIFECVYSHIIKIILFFGNAPKSLLNWLFPAPTYHLPDNLFFEATGVTQIVGLWAAWMAYRVFRNRKFTMKKTLSL